MKRALPHREMLKDALDILVLRKLVGGDAHGHAVARAGGETWVAVRRCTGRRIAGGFPTYWGASENNHRAKFYRLTAVWDKTAWARDQPLAAGDASDWSGDRRGDAGLQRRYELAHVLSPGAARTPKCKARSSRI